MIPKPRIQVALSEQFNMDHTAFDNYTKGYEMESSRKTARKHDQKYEIEDQFRHLQKRGVKGIEEKKAIISSLTSGLSKIGKRTNKTSPIS